MTSNEISSTLGALPSVMKTLSTKSHLLKSIYQKLSTEACPPKPVHQKPSTEPVHWMAVHSRNRIWIPWVQHHYHPTINLPPLSSVGAQIGRPRTSAVYFTIWRIHFFRISFSKLPFQQGLSNFKIWSFVCRVCVSLCKVQNQFSWFYLICFNWNRILIGFFFRVARWWSPASGRSQPMVHCE